MLARGGQSQLADSDDRGRVRADLFVRRIQMTVASFWPWQLIAAMLLNCVVQAVSIAAYAARLAGARSGRVGTAMSLYNLFVTASRFASMLYTPMLGALSDHAQHGGTGADFLSQLRWIVFAGTAGAVIGTFALPAFVGLYLRGIGAFERTGNVLKALLRALRPKTMAGVLREIVTGGQPNTFRFSLAHVPLDVLVFNTLVSSVYSIGIVSAVYASVLNADAARTALLSSGLVNGVAVIAYNVVVDPASAYMTDQTVRGERTLDDVRALVTSLSLTAILGFLLSQLFLLPAAFAIGIAAHAISGH
jgi:hypothetical protein